MGAPGKRHDRPSRGHNLMIRALIDGVLHKRYKRFADVELADGTVVTAHCANTDP